MVDDVRPSEADGRELAKDAMESFSDAYDTPDDGDEGDAVTRAIERAVAEHGA